MLKSSSPQKLQNALSATGRTTLKGFAVLPGATVGLTHTEFLKDYKIDLCV